MFHARIEDRGKHADYQKAVARARTAGRTPPARYRIRWRTETGHLRSLSVATRDLARAIQADIAYGRAPLTLNRLVDLWSAMPVRPTRPLAPPRLPNRRPLDLHTLPRLGAKLAITITRADIEHLVSALRAEGHLSLATINGILATLKRALEFGVRHGHLASNPALGVRPIPRPA
ncbi:hypothetical protein ABH940_003297 [Streptacidiphilus sp. BW17]|uniref:hypothetical protein n=1 Tax=unclassified Streptacidiphilus TaxID=2643834 RepID=UPI0035134CD9